MEIATGMMQLGVVVGGKSGINVEAFIVEERKDGTKKIIIENGNAYILGQTAKK